MKKKIMAVALATATVTSMVGAVGVSAATDVAKSDLAYKGELEIMHYSTSEESEGNGGSDGFRTVLAAWQEAHPDITLNENVLANAEYKTQIATLAAADNLPDVFLLQGMNTKAWAEQGLIMDLTDTIKASPYYDQYDQDYFTPFKDGDKLYGYPVLTGGKKPDTMNSHQHGKMLKKHPNISKIRALIQSHLVTAVNGRQTVTGYQH